METTIVQPGSTPSIYATGHPHHNDRHHGDGDHRELRTDADYRALTQQVERFGTLNGDRTLTGVQVTGDRINTVGAAGALASCHTNELVQSTSCATDRLVGAGFGGVHDRLCDSTGKIIHEIDRHGDASALASCKTDDAIADSKLFNAVEFKNQVIEANKNASNLAALVQTVGNAAQVLASTIGNAAQVQATSNYNGLSVQAVQNYNGTTVQIERIRAELGAKQDAGFAAATLVAFQNKADSDAKAAECCCALKALILAQAEATRAQGADFRMRDLEGRLNRIPVGVAVTIPPGL